MTPIRICLTFDIDLVDYAGDGAAIDEFADAVPSIQSMFDRHPDWTATWFVRLDDQIASIFGHPAAVMERHASVLTGFRARGHEVGWHPHSYLRGEDGGWRQNTDDARVADELARLAPLAQEHGCLTVRSGWGFHTNRTMRTVAEAGFAIDSSAIPRPRYRWEPSVKDWTTTPLTPYYPGVNDYRVPGEPSLPILEVPMSVAVVRAPTDTEVVIRYLNPAFHQPLFAPAARTWLQSRDHVVTVTHPYEAMASRHTHPVIAYDAATLEANIGLLEAHARDEQRAALFMTLSQFASSGPRA